MFFDELELELEGGQGGNGMLSFHKEKFIAHGPPDGGDGGNGGNVIIQADANYNTFRHFSGKKKFKAERGVGGHKNNRAGRRGEDIVLKVPEGTLIHDTETGEQLADLKKHGDFVLAALGGRGGFGNGHFVSSTRQAPRFAELGDIGQKRHIKLELQLLADVGLLGFPSVGKSTLISHLSEARPKIGDYPFTTLVPNLGVVNLSKFGGGEEQSFVLADMPGIIEGASEGKGLGDRFLRHISRSAILVYVLDPFAYDNAELWDQFNTLHNELKEYNAELLDKSFRVAINKMDAIPDDEKDKLKNEFIEHVDVPSEHLHLISGVSGEGLEDFVFDLWKMVDASSKEQADELGQGVEAESTYDDEGIPQYEARYFVDDQSFEVEKMYEVAVSEFEPTVHHVLIDEASKPKRTLFKISGNRIEQISRMTNLDQPDAIQRIYDVLKKMNIQNELVRQGAVNGDYLHIGPHFFEFHELKPKKS